MRIINISGGSAVGSPYSYNPPCSPGQNFTPEKLQAFKPDTTIVLNDTLPELTADQVYSFGSYYINGGGYATRDVTAITNPNATYRDSALKRIQNDYDLQNKDSLDFLGRALTQNAEKKAGINAIDINGDGTTKADYDAIKWMEITN